MEPLGTISTAQAYGMTQQATITTPAVDTTQAPAERQAIKLPEDRVSLSGRRPEASQAPRQSTKQDPTANEPKPGEQTTPDGKSVEDPQVKQVVERLKQTEEKVKAHEAAHKSAGGNLASSASYSYTQGPDGRSYITGGEVQIDMSPGKTPQETISKMQQVIRAALAPADPSGQDRAVAAQAGSQMAQAQQQKLQADSPTSPSQGTETSDPAQQAQAQQAYADPAVRAGNSPSSRNDTTASQQPGNDNQRSATAGLSAYA